MIITLVVITWSVAAVENKISSVFDSCDWLNDAAARVACAESCCGNSTVAPQAALLSVIVANSYGLGCIS